MAPKSYGDEGIDFDFESFRFADQHFKWMLLWRIVIEYSIRMGKIWNLRFSG